ncbi:WW domain protein [Aspergillus homomorphus CBS 101889]|uniref:WW domain-containing protein n=1 Tax=Aspergillus homomorphus (strain CBS 101889) TaxID=1450537 RepID=A0A395I165_ASPHC|nr:hypothetical protein BO97DRAFT_48243 [Aspergillus homomorphus CBS 101889]RAL12898.1 hypothetical protein BO97DRAFT_48243 [Aspergillus homomorphus CBS 101889]
MSYYGQQQPYYQERPPYERPPYDAPPSDRPPYERPPYDRPPYDRPPSDRPPYQGSPYERPPYQGGPPPERPPYEGADRSFDSRPPYASPPPSSRPPPVPPPPLPMGWTQEWEPNVRRAFYVEVPTGRSQWEPPLGDTDGSRDLAPAGPPAGYYGAPSPAPPQPEGGYYPPPQQGGYYPPQQQGGEYVDPEEQKSRERKKMMMGAAAGLALGAVGGALLNHELGKSYPVTHRPSFPLERIANYFRTEEHSGSSSDEEREGSPQREIYHEREVYIERDVERDEEPAYEPDDW